jgi:glycosyltransferase involved in cell wall biosynthesis
VGDRRPFLSVSLCTVRGRDGFLDAPGVDPVLDTIRQLRQQTFKDFEFVIADGLYEMRKEAVAEAASRVDFPVKHVPPRQTLFVRGRKYALSSYRNTAHSWVRGEVVLALDDCGIYPDNFLEYFALAAQRGVFAACLYPDIGTWHDDRREGLVRDPGYVYSFNSFSRNTLYQINGHDEMYDGAHSTEDQDFSARLFHVDLPMVLLRIPGYRMHDQAPYDSSLVDPYQADRLDGESVKCNRTVWETQRRERVILKANTAEQWADKNWIAACMPPCRYYRESDQKCRHYGDYSGRCTFVGSPHMFQPHPLTLQLYDEPPVFDLVAAAKENGVF